MVRHETGHAVEPKVREHGEDFAFLRDAVGQHDVVGADAVAGQHQETVSEVEHFTDLAAADLGDTGEIKLKQSIARHGGG